MSVGTTSLTLVDAVLARIQMVQNQLLGKLDELDAATITHQGSLTAPPIAFHAWHIARFADRISAVLTGTEERWTRDAVAERWSMPDVDLGLMHTGIGVPDAAALNLPGDETLRAYVAACFDDVHRAASSLAGDLDRQFDVYGGALEPTVLSVGQVMVAHASHVNRHLGMIEALVGVAGMRGTVSL